jgi:hypothetical protein
MKTTTQRRPARLAGLLLLSLLVFATGVQAAQAALVSGSGAGSGTASFASTPAGTQGRGGAALASSTPATHLQGLTAATAAQHDQGTTVSATAATTPAGTQGRGGVAVASLTPAQPQGLTAAQRHHYFGRFQPTSNVLAAQPASSGATSRSAWIAAGAAAAIFIVGFAAWALTRRRRQPGDHPSEAYCAQHPEDAMCTAA